MTQYFSELEDIIRQVVEEVNNKFKEKPKVAIAGFGKTGKSSLFNAIYGENKVKVSMKTNQTTESVIVDKFGIDFTDTPGIGTADFSFEKVIETGILDKQNVIIHCLSAVNAITAEDKRLHDFIIEKSPHKRITVVNKFDKFDDEQEKEEYTESMKEQLNLDPNEFLFISAKKHINLNLLIMKILEILPYTFQEAFIAQQKVDLEIKEKHAFNIIIVKSILAGAVALIPIPIADIFIIGPIQIAMVGIIGQIFGFEITTGRIKVFLTTIGAGLGLRELGRQLLKLLPGYGTVLSAGVAFAGTFAIGMTAIYWFKHDCKVNEFELKDIFAKYAIEGEKKYKDYEKEIPKNKEKAEEYIYSRKNINT